MKNFSPIWLLQFQLLMKTGSFSEAAGKLNITQQALSHNIQSLETWAGQYLFHRLPGQLRLTPSGKLLLQEIPRLLYQLQMAYLATQEVQTGFQLGISAFWCQHFLTDALLDLLEQEPHLELQISPLSEEDIFTCLLAGELDMGLSIYPPWQGFHSQALPPVPWVLAGVPSLRASSDPFPYFVLNSEEWPGRFHVDVNLMPQPARCAGYTNSFPMMRSLLLSGLGGGFILRPYVQEDVAAGRLVIFDTPPLPSIIPYAVWLKDISHSTWMRPLLDSLVLEMNHESL